MDRNDLITRSRIGRDQHDGHPDGAWSTGEQLAVALVLDDIEHIQAMGYTALEAALRVQSGMAPAPGDIAGWLREIQREIGL